MNGCRFAVAAVLALSLFGLAGQALAQPCLMTAKPFDNPNLLDAAARLEAGSSN